ncbi:flavoprotein [Saccharothrix coeruleofusca]|uniref:Flavoprotein n=1 Tax=Saccharothrix coeruleofusca TaxID=33919 RepID=A0A918ANR6_9PSEU|nr:flavoprotein [Saccharothrix coeruleofusca]GGP64295.1 flavoprotein [Saccharothrix coeruleofusca]
MSPSDRCAYVVASAAPPVLRVADLVTRLTGDGWRVCLVATPTAASWVDLDAIAAGTGCIARAAPDPPGRGTPLPRADAVLAAPLTFNSANKWAAGISDNLALGLLNELLGVDVPVIAAPCVKESLRRHPAYGDSVARLTAAGVVLVDAVAGRGPDGLVAFDWARLADALHHAAVDPGQARVRPT